MSQTGDNLSNKLLRSSLFAIVLMFPSLWAGGAAIITLEMPVGARQLGMGEAGVATSNDAAAVYYNPAGLAFGPVANEWELTEDHPSKDIWYTALTARARRGFLARRDLWAGTPKGLMHFDGRTWRHDHSEVLEGAATIRDVVRTFIGTENGLDSITTLVKKYNDVKTKTDESYLVEVKLPWSLVLHDTITTMLYDDRTEKLWIGTSKGLFRFDGRGFKNYHLEIGQMRINALAFQGATLWIGTQDGLYSYRNGQFERKGVVLPSQVITSLAWSEMRQELYVGVYQAGVARLKPKRNPKEKDRWNLYNQEDGLMDIFPVALAVDSSGHIWAAHQGGLSHFNLRKWEQVRFDQNEVHDLAISESGDLWIATSKGVWRHTPEYATAKGRKSEKERKGEKQEAGSGEWAHFHTGNGLQSNYIYKLLPQGNDVWFSTQAGMERFNQAESQLAFFYEKLLPVLNIPDLYHLFAGATFPAAEWGTLGGFVNFISFGQTVVSSETTNEDLSYMNSSETVVGLSYGTRLSKKWGLGLNFKFFYSNLSNGASVGEEAATTASYAVDVGLLGKDLLNHRLNIGLMLANIGPNVYYLDKSDDDPIPLTWRMGLAVNVLETVDHRIVITGDYNKQVIYYDSRGNAQPFYVSSWKAWGYPENLGSDASVGTRIKETFQQGVINLGVEYIYANTVALRGGYLYDELGQREEAHWGLGIMLSDVLQLDISSIQGISDLEGVRDGQMRFGLLFKF